VTAVTDVHACIECTQAWALTDVDFPHIDIIHLRIDSVSWNPAAMELDQLHGQRVSGKPSARLSIQHA
jgi:hypothetical protein